MSARLVWITTCDVCDTTLHHVGTLTVDELGAALRDAAWDLPIYGGTFCPRCAAAVKKLSRR